MTNRLKVLTIMGTRPEIIRLSCTIKKLDEFTDHTVVHTGQNYDYELNQIFFEELEIRQPDYFLNAAGIKPMQTIGNCLINIDDVLEKINPDAVLILGDTNSALCSIAVKRRKIPIFHMEAGNRCFDYNVPEEINRKIVDHISDINLTYSQTARDYLIAEGFPADQVIKTGSPMREVLNHYAKKINQSKILETLQLVKNKYVLVSCHREENVESPEKLGELLKTLDFIAKTYNVPIIFSTHPRTKKRLEPLLNQDSYKHLATEIQFLKPFGFCDYVQLQQLAMFVLSDSGTITEESSILNFPALNIRDAHERPEGFEEASVIFTGIDSKRIQQALPLLIQQPRGENNRLLKLVTDYQADNVSDKVLRIILSYTDFVNQKVWKKK